MYMRNGGEDRFEGEGAEAKQLVEVRARVLRLDHLHCTCRVTHKQTRSLFLSPAHTLSHTHALSLSISPPLSLSLTHTHCGADAKQLVEVGARVLRLNHLCE